MFNSSSNVVTSALHALRPKNRNETAESESRALLGSNSDTPSLSSRYDGFERSSTAFTHCIFHVTCYYLTAILCFCFLFEKWSLIDSIYFATVLFTTVGFGDLSPSTFLGRAAVIILAVYGIVLLGIFLGIAGESITEYQTKMWDRQRNDVRRKILKTVEKAVAEKSDTGVARSSETSRIEPAEVEESLLQEIKEVMTLEAPILLVVLSVGVVLGHFQGWSVFESIYFTVITGTTIGFGDYYPDQPLVRLACCFFLPLLVAVLGQFLATVASVYMKSQRRRLELNFLSRIMTEYDLEAMDENKMVKYNKLNFSLSCS